MLHLFTFYSSLFGYHLVVGKAIQIFFFFLGGWLGWLP